MSIRRRVEDLEGRGGGGGRCDNCRDWRPTRLSGINWRTNKPYTNGLPERCPVCGFTPIHITIIGIDDWRGQREVRPV
jgi:hypothetical protein